ncbi:MAG: retropepsin-like aspartic protease [Gammaproteobacteria bacterium]|nr:retropepsin-like aspartic protease [Gammaproteobacteria bacterium]
MKHAFPVLLIAIISFYLGWLANDLVTQGDESASLTTSHTPEPEAPVTTGEVRRLPGVTEVVESPAQLFRQLLAGQAFEEAVLLFEQVAESDEAQLPLLRADLLAHLRYLLQQDNNESLVALVDAWLSRYYDDVDVLIILAEYQRRQGYPDEAARVVQFAFTYALDPAQRESVSRFFQGLVEKTDAAWSRQQQWVELLGFYQLLESIGLSEPAFQLRHAAISLALEDFSTARELLLPLTGNIEWAGKAKELLSLMKPQVASVPERESRGDAIPLLRRGGHYLVTVSLNGDSEVTLMIDTGASMSSVSKDTFKALSRRSFYDYLGWRLFNTANGVTRANIYRATEFRIGAHVLQDVDLAVLELGEGRGIDGLLGMNVLQYYRFEIDQDEGVLYLQER